MCRSMILNKLHMNRKLIIKRELQRDPKVIRHIQQIVNEGLELSGQFQNSAEIQQLEFANLLGVTKLELENNLITDLQFLARVNAPDLEVLILDNNQIAKLDGLSKLTFLRELEKDIGNNKGDFTLRRYFTGLLTLSLRNNLIEDISPMETMEIRFLRKLNLNNNLISDIKPLANLPFFYLEELGLSGNKLESIEAFTRCKFKNLQSLHLYNNFICDIEPLKYAQLQQLSTLDIYNNHIHDLSVFRRVNMNLERLDLYNNQISNVLALTNYNKQKLVLLYIGLGKNGIIREQVMKIRKHISRSESTIMLK